jgi:hypothetical protein
VSHGVLKRRLAAALLLPQANREAEPKKHEFCRKLFAPFRVTYFAAFWSGGFEACFSDRLEPGRPDWAKFRPLGDSLIWVVLLHSRPNVWAFFHGESY